MKSLSGKEMLLTFPSLLWLAVFFIIPTAIIAAYSFKPADLYGGVLEGWTLQTLANLYNPYLFALLFRTLWISVSTMCITLFLGLLIAYQIVSTSKRWRNFLLIMIVIPFWSSFLIRIFAWKIVLHPEGPFHDFLAFIGIIAPRTTLLYNSFAVLLVMVYALLPFAVLPIYSAASKFNFQLMEAAMDLGASRFWAFCKVFIPGVKKGVATGAIVVFITAFGTYVIPDLVGGAKSEMIGNKIAQKIFVERNIPEASAFSFILGLSLFLPIAGIAFFSRFDKAKRNRE